MNIYSEQLETLLELEHRHEELLQQLEDLDKRVEKVLVEWQGVARLPDRRDDARIAEPPMRVDFGSFSVPSFKEMRAFNLELWELPRKSAEGGLRNRPEQQREWWPMPSSSW